MLDVDVAGVKRVAGRPATRIEIRSTMPVGRVVDLVSSAHVATEWPDPLMVLEGSPDVFLVEGPKLVPTGVVVGIEPTSYRDFERTLHAWTATLQAAGLRGAIGPYRPDHPPFHFIKAPTNTLNLVAALVFRGDDEGVGGARQVPDSVRGEFLIKAQEWGQAGGDAIHVGHGLVAGRLHDNAEIAGFVSSALSVATPVSVHWSGDSAFRTVGWDQAGHAWLQVADRRPWFERVAEVEAFIESFAAHLTYACVRLCWADQMTWPDAISGNGVAEPPAAGRHYVSVMSAADETERVPDACGSQLMGREQLSAAHDLSHWSHTPVSDMTWVRAATPADWFADVPTSDVVEAARVDFGDAILTRERYHAAWRRNRERNAKAFRGR